MSVLLPFFIKLNRIVRHLRLDFSGNFSIIADYLKFIAMDISELMIMLLNLSLKYTCNFAKIDYVECKIFDAISLLDSFYLLDKIHLVNEDGNAIIFQYRFNYNS